LALFIKNIGYLQVILLFIKRKEKNNYNLFFIPEWSLSRNQSDINAELYAHETEYTSEDMKKSYQWILKIKYSL